MKKKTALTIRLVNDAEEGLRVGKSFLYDLLDDETLLLLSGGRTPKELYSELVKEGRLRVGAVGLVDERYGSKYHENSNEAMIRDTGLEVYLATKKISYHLILQENKSRIDTASLYDKALRSLFRTFKKSVAIVGIGLDGHTLGIAGNRLDFINPMFDNERKKLLVSEFNDKYGMFKERITMTFAALLSVSAILVLAFGSDKKDALLKIFQEGPVEEVPARIFTRPDIAAKTTLITDQELVG